MVSACLVGHKCRYDGGSKPNAQVLALYARGEAVAFCPECLGGLTVPREPSEIEPGFSGVDVLNGKARVLTAGGLDVTEAFLAGAENALRMCVEIGAKLAILKSHSPSCGCDAIYDGTFSGVLSGGDGVTAALLKRHGIAVQCR